MLYVSMGEGDWKCMWREGGRSRFFFGGGGGKLKIL